VGLCGCLFSHVFLLIVDVRAADKNYIRNLFMGGLGQRYANTVKLLWLMINRGAHATPGRLEGFRAFLRGLEREAVLLRTQLQAIDPLLGDFSVEHFTADCLSCMYRYESARAANNSNAATKVILLFFSESLRNNFPQARAEMLVTLRLSIMSVYELFRSLKRTYEYFKRLVARKNAEIFNLRVEVQDKDGRLAALIQQLDDTERQLIEAEQVITVLEDSNLKEADIAENEDSEV
jgi:hypothetical protein